MPRLFLVGYRATGKTTVGRLAAGRLGCSFVDADAHLEAAVGKSVRDLFRDEGEAGFRDRESAILRELATDARWDRHVISTGGGVVIRPENRALLRAGFVARLTASAATIHARMVADAELHGTRPNLTPGGGLQEVEALLAAREAWYCEVADVIVPTEGRSPDAVASDIVSEYLAARPTPPPESQA